MPQTDLVTFLPLGFTTFGFYSFFYLFLNATALFSVVTSLKFDENLETFVAKEETSKKDYATKVAPWINTVATK